MKLIRAKFQNFRLLRDLELEFANKANKKLTVIRAANDSGKTTILHALQWALYGDVSLPDRRENFRLHPIDWEISDGKRVLITATVEFEVTNSRLSLGGTVQETRQCYRLVRSTYEYVDGTSSRHDPTTVKLFMLTDTGASPIDTPETWINDELPPELREVFFTDGDRVLKFIEADVARSTRRERVERAIRSLLGLSVIEDSIRHVRNAATEVNRKARQVGTDSELNKVASKLEEIEELREKLEAELEDAKQQFGAFSEKCGEIDREIAAVLQNGDKEALKKDLECARRDIERLDSQLKEANKEHSTLFSSRALAEGLLAPLLGKAFEKLKELHDQGKIPNTTIPVLRDRLTAEICICGETLAPSDRDGNKRRAHIQKLIDDNQHADEIQKIITEIYFSSELAQGGGDTEDSTWLEAYRKVSGHREDILESREDAGRKLRSLELQLDSLPDTDIKGLRETQRQYNNQRDRFLMKQSEIDTQLAGLRREGETLESKRDQLLGQQQRGAQILAEKDVIHDVMNALRSAYEYITKEELRKVSDLMNEIFLEMIGADLEQVSIIRRAEISAEFDIIVYGPKNRTLNPDSELNGASRRALTLAFILALTKVSEVEAPNVIDTPLGMTSGYVKRSILKTAVRESTQLILFLTHDEIFGCEEIIDEASGEVFTLTNSSHYPKMLVNDPGVIERKTLRCKCNHRSECQLCQRRVAAKVEPDIVS